MMQWSEDKISQLIMEKVLGMTGREEDALLQQLMEENPAVRDQYEAAKATIGSANEQGIYPPDPEKGWQQIAPLLSGKEYVKKRRPLWAAAAVLLLLLLAGGSYMIWHKGHHQQPVYTATKQLQLQLANGKTLALAGTQGNIAAGNATLTNDAAGRILHYRPTGDPAEDAKINTLSVPPGMDYRIVLSDGTIVTLNSATQLRFPFTFSGRTREITINGEAYLEVAHDASKPFIVHIPGSTVQVLGTQFNINTYNRDAVKVSLVEGSLKFAAGSQSLMLVPGREGVWTGATLTERPVNTDELAWTRGEYIMNNTTVSNIAALLPRWYGVQVVLDDQAIATKRFSGIIYKNRPLENFLEMLKGTTDADYYFEGGVLHLK